MTTGDDGEGRLEAIWIKRARQGPMDSRDRAELAAGRGLVGNANQRGHRQVTIVEAEKWEAVSRELGFEVDPIVRRANLLVSGLSLESCRDRVLELGACRVRMLGETRPCRRMEETVPGLQAALDPDWRAGAYGQVIEGGVITVGVGVRWE